MTPKRTAFALEYLVDLNATAAARRAGYSAAWPARQAWALLQEPEIQRQMDARARRTNITIDRTIF